VSASSPNRQHATSFISGARVVAGLTLVSRVLGLVRDMVCSRVFGVGPVWSSFALAFLLPNLFRRLFGEGALSAAFLPTYAELVETDEKAAQRFARLVLLGVMTALTLLVLLGEVVLALLLLTPVAETGGLAIRLAMLMLPYMPLICAVALLGGMLQTHHRFGPTAAAPIVLNLCIITAALVFLENIWAVAVAVLVAGLLQVGWSAWALRSIIDWRGPVTGAGAHLKKMLALAGPMMLGLGALQISTFLDGLIAGYPVTFGPTLPEWLPGALGGVAYPLDEASNAVLYYGQRLYQFPLGVFGLAIATAIYPSLSRLASDRPAFTETLQRGLRLSLFIALPASVGLLLVAKPLAATLFLGGRFDLVGVERVGAVLAAYSTAVWAYSLNHLLTRAYYARGDSRTPVRVSITFLSLNLALNLTLIWFVGEVGLAIATAACAILQAAALLFVLDRRIGDADSDSRLTSHPLMANEGAVGSTGPAAQHVLDRATMRGCLWIFILSAAMGLALWLIAHLLGDAADWSTWLMQLAFLVIAGLVIFGAGAIITRRPELRWLLARGR
jgi:putative peptidoglycan lipid II flippase